MQGQRLACSLETILMPHSEPPNLLAPDMQRQTSHGAFLKALPLHGSRDGGGDTGGSDDPWDRSSQHETKDRETGPTRFRLFDVLRDDGSENRGELVDICPRNASKQRACLQFKKTVRSNCSETETSRCPRLRGLRSLPGSRVDLPGPAAHFSLPGHQHFINAALQR